MNFWREKMKKNFLKRPISVFVESHERRTRRWVHSSLRALKKAALRYVKLNAESWFTLPDHSDNGFKIFFEGRLEEGVQSEFVVRLFLSHDNMVVYETKNGLKFDSSILNGDLLNGNIVRALDEEFSRAMGVDRGNVEEIGFGFKKSVTMDF